jgi:hypothetical protein
MKCLVRDDLYHLMISRTRQELGRMISRQDFDACASHREHLALLKSMIPSIFVKPEVQKRISDGIDMEIMLIQHAPSWIQVMIQDLPRGNLSTFISFLDQPHIFFNGDMNANIVKPFQEKMSPSQSSLSGHLYGIGFDIICFNNPALEKEFTISRLMMNMRYILASPDLPPDQKEALTAAVIKKVPDIGENLERMLRGEPLLTSTPLPASKTTASSVVEERTSWSARQARSLEREGGCQVM